MLLIDLKRVARVLALALPLLVPAMAFAESEQEVISIKRDGELFTITLTEAQPVEDVLLELAEEFGAEVEGGEDSGEVGPIKLVRVSLHQALREILQKQSFSVQFAEGASDPTLIRVAARKVAAVEVAQPEADGETPAAPTAKELLIDALKNKKADAAASGGGLEGLLGKNPQLKLLKTCAALMKLPQHRGKQSETLVTAEGESCPRGIKVFGL